MSTFANFNSINFEENPITKMPEGYTLKNGEIISSEGVPIIAFIEGKPFIEEMWLKPNVMDEFRLMVHELPTDSTKEDMDAQFSYLKKEILNYTSKFKFDCNQLTQQHIGMLKLINVELNRISFNNSMSMFKYVYNKIIDVRDEFKPFEFCSGNPVQCQKCVLIHQIIRTINDIGLPLVQHPTNYPKLSQDFENLAQTMRIDLSSISPANIMPLLDIQNIHLICNPVAFCSDSRSYSMVKVLYNRILRTVGQLSNDEGLNGEELELIQKVTQIVDAMSTTGPEPTIIPNDYDEFMIAWRNKKFDNRDPSTLFPRQRMYRQHNYCRGIDMWAFTHSNMLNHMQGNEFWRLHSNPYQELIQIIYNTMFEVYPQCVEKIMREFDLDGDFLPPPLHLDTYHLVKRWDFANMPILPTNTFLEKYYSNIIDEFIEYAERSDNERTDQYLNRLKILNTRIMFVREWLSSNLQDAVKNIKRTVNLSYESEEDQPRVSILEEDAIKTNTINELISYELMKFEYNGVYDKSKSLDLANRIMIMFMDMTLFRAVYQK